MCAPFFCSLARQYWSIGKKILVDKKRVVTLRSNINLTNTHDYERKE